MQWYLHLLVAIDVRLHSKSKHRVIATPVNYPWRYVHIETRGHGRTQQNTQNHRHCQITQHTIKTCTLFKINSSSYFVRNWIVCGGTCGHPDGRRCTALVDDWMRTAPTAPSLASEPTEGIVFAGFLGSMTEIVFSWVYSWLFTRLKVSLKKCKGK